MDDVKNASSVEMSPSSLSSGVTLCSYVSLIHESFFNLTSLTGVSATDVNIVCGLYFIVLKRLERRRLLVLGSDRQCRLGRGLLLSPCGTLGGSQHQVTVVESICRPQQLLPHLNQQRRRSTLDCRVEQLETDANLGL